LGVIGAYVAAAAAVYLAVRALLRPSSRWSLDNLIKGERAEQRVGQAIEYAITASNCAVAHSVTEIAKVGDIDHLVATPAAIWVIETKYRKVPKKDFPRVLARIAENTQAVRRWAPDGSTVRGCLVLAFEDKFHKKNFGFGKETITAYNPAQLAREMSTEAGRERSLDERVATDIWRLGKIAE
jgi:predicted nucleic acid-binding Zn finger protein